MNNNEIIEEMVKSEKRVKRIILLTVILMVGLAAAFFYVKDRMDYYKTVLSWQEKSVGLIDQFSDSEQKNSLRYIQTMKNINESIKIAGTEISRSQTLIFFFRLFFLGLIIFLITEIVGLVLVKMKNKKRIAKSFQKNLQ